MQTAGLNLSALIAFDEWQGSARPICISLVQANDVKEAYEIQ
jgi:hypothetical protein